MLSKTIDLNNIKEDLKELSRYPVVVYGGYVKDRSIRDVDVAVITKSKDQSENMHLWYDLIGKFPQVYDIKIFELLPLTIKISIINNYKVIFGNSPDVSEYFYFYRKLWNDQKHRIEENRFKSYEEKIRAINRWRKVNNLLSA